jgi:hypothetical protein
MAVVAFSGVFAILESTGDLWGIAGAGFIAWSTGLCSNAALIAVEEVDGFGMSSNFAVRSVDTAGGVCVTEGFCSESLPKKPAARTPLTANTPIAAEKIPKRFFVRPCIESSLVACVPTATAAVKPAEW